MTSRKLNKETATVTINIHSERVNETTQYKYLGVILDHHFNLHEQVTTVYNKAFSRLKFLKRVRNNLTSYVAERIYKSMVQPIITYCPMVYLGLPTYLIGKLQSIHEKGRWNVCSQQTNAEWKFISEISNQQIILDVHKVIKRTSPIVFQDYFKPCIMERIPEEMAVPLSSRVWKQRSVEKPSNSKAARCLTHFR